MGCSLLALLALLARLALVGDRINHHLLRLHCNGALGHLVLALDALADHLVDSLHCHTCDRAEPRDDLLVLEQKDLAEDELIRSKAHLLNLSDVVDHLFHNMAVL